MKFKVIDTTDDKFIGNVLEREVDDPILLNDKEFKYQKIQNLGHNLYRYSNSNYVVLVKEIVNE